MLCRDQQQQKIQIHFQLAVGTKKKVTKIIDPNFLLKRPKRLLKEIREVKAKVRIKAAKVKVNFDWLSLCSLLIATKHIDRQGLPRLHAVVW